MQRNMPPLLNFQIFVTYYSCLYTSFTNFKDSFDNHSKTQNIEKSSRTSRTLSRTICKFSVWVLVSSISSYFQVSCVWNVLKYHVTKIEWNIFKCHWYFAENQSVVQVSPKMIFKSPKFYCFSVKLPRLQRGNELTHFISTLC